MDNLAQIAIKVTYKYKDHTRTANVAKYSTLRDVRKLLEKQIHFSIKQMKLLYKNNNILLKNETTKVYNYFGDVKEITLILEHKDFAEDEFIEKFEKAFVGVAAPEETNEDDKKDKKIKHLKSLKDQKDFKPRLDDRPVCNYDGKNEATYVCLKCGQYWCQYCLKFEVHKNDICELAKLDKTLEYNRGLYLKELNESVINNPYYAKLAKIDFLLNEKVSVIDKQFNDMVNIIQKIKESQMKFIIDYFYQKINDKKYKALNGDLDFYKQTINNIADHYDSKNVPENIKNDQTLRSGLDIILKKFNEFQIKFKDFDNIYIQFENFNQTFLSQLEAKLTQSSNVGKSIQNPEEMEREITMKKDVDEKIKNKNKATSLIKIKYYNSIMIWNHLNQKLLRISDFQDKFEFKLNYQVYAGNIFLNHRGKLFIVTGQNFNMFYFYDPKLNEVIRLPSLAENHCRGGMLYLEFYNSIFCISGKYTKEIEFFNMKYLKYPTTKDDTSVKGSKSESINFMNDDKIKWESFPRLNIARHYSSFFVYNSSYLYVFFGYNQRKGYLDSVEKIDLKEPKEFELIKYENPKGLELKRSSMGICYANADEIYILGGTIGEKFTDEILKYNFQQNCFFKTQMKIPAINENEYFRFWEESTFVPLTSQGHTVNSDDDFTFGMIDARDKVHLFNIKTFKYNIV